MSQNTRLTYEARANTLPHKLYYYGHPDPYLQPGQSKYHNLGLNGRVQSSLRNWGGSYPGKDLGRLGDYGPRQKTINQEGYPYLTDANLHQVYHSSRDAHNKRYHFVGCNQPNTHP